MQDICALNTIPELFVEVDVRLTVRNSEDVVDAGKHSN